jgi:hypothetical protein
MTDQMERLIASYYEDSIELADGKLLIFRRIPNYRFTERTAVAVLLEDTETQTTIELGIHFDAKWTFSSPANERSFWQVIKQNSSDSRKIIKQMRLPIPGREVFAYQLQIKSMSGRVVSRIDKLTTIFKEDHHG